MKPTPLEHWRKVLADPRSSEIAKRYATEALSKIDPERFLQREVERDREPERQPGEDTEEDGL